MAGLTRALVSLPPLVLALVVVLPPMVLALGALRVIRRHVPHDVLSADSGSTSAVYAMVGVVYAVILGFVIVVVWQQFGDASAGVQREVSELGVLLRDAKAFPQPVREDVTERIVAYARAVVDEEWATMAKGERSPAALAAYERVWEAYYAYEPATPQAAAFRDESLGVLTELSRSRRERVLAARSSVPTLLWVMLVLGGVVVIGYTLLLSVRNAVLHAVSVAVVTLVVSVALFIVLTLDHPFTGSLRIDPYAFQDLVAMWTRRGG